MKTIKRIFIFILVLITIGLIHYYLPQRDIVQVVNTDVKRMDISKGSPFWIALMPVQTGKPPEMFALSTPLMTRIRPAFIATRIPAGHSPFI